MSAEHAGMTRYLQEYNQAAVNGKPIPPADLPHGERERVEAFLALADPDNHGFYAASRLGRVANTMVTSSTQSSLSPSSSEVNAIGVDILRQRFNISTQQEGEN